MSDEIKRPDIEGALDRAERASPGPWTPRVQPLQRGRNPDYTTFPEVFAQDPRWGSSAAVVARAYSWGCQRAPRSAPDKFWGAVDNATFIASARADVPELAAYALALEGRLRALGWSHASMTGAKSALECKQATVPAKFNPGED